MNKNNIAVGIAIIILIILGAIWLTRPSLKNDTTPPKYSKGYLSAYETNFDFGQVLLSAGKISHTFNIKNTGNEPVIIEKIDISCECAEVALRIGGQKFGPYGISSQKLNFKIIKAININEEATAEIIFNPSSLKIREADQIQATIILGNNTGQPLEFRFTAIVKN